jgi:AcrR family transcriptional regulator
LPRKPPGKSRLESARERMYRELVFESAEHVFARKGFEDASMQEIAAEAGISLKTLYANTPGKNELYAEIQAVRTREFVDLVAVSMQAGESAADALARGVRAYVHFLVRHPDFMRIHLREGRAWALRPAGGEAEQGWLRGVGNFAEVIRRGIQEGRFYDGDPETMAMMGIAVLQVLLARHVGELDAAHEEALVEEMLLQLRRMLGGPEGARGAGRSAA